MISARRLSNMLGNKYLVLRLKGPMQSWGLRAKFDNRTTETMPTKSGIIGLVAAALGLDRSDSSGLAEISKLKLMTICVQEGTVMTDFHTVGAGHTDPEKCLRTVDGKGSIPRITRRQYLCDYEFLAVLDGAAGVIDRCSAAVRDSVYTLGLGRKCCFPSMPIHVGVCQDKKELVTCLQANKWKEGQRVSCEVDKGGQLEQDVPVSFRDRKFTSRRISGDATDWLT
jgi:CRISPR system Cascade subunit CasD